MEENEDPTRIKSQQLHRESQQQYDKEQNALCYVVIGGIFLIIGVLFIFLAFRRVNNVMTHIDVTSLAFYIMLLGLVLGSAGLGYGLVRFFVAKKKRKDILKQIRDLK